MSKRDSPPSALTPVPKWDVVLWDFDGTLADTSRDVWGSLHYAARRRGASFPAGFDEDDENLGLPMEAIYGSLRPSPDPCDLALFERDVRVHYRCLSMHPETRLYPGMRELLEELRRRGARGRIVTNKPRGALERILSRKGWARLFDGWISSDSGVDQELSKAQMIERAMRAEDASPSGCVMVGDSWGDVAGAQAMGVQSVAVTYGDGDVGKLLAAGPTYVAHDVGQLAEILLGSSGNA